VGLPTSNCPAPSGISSLGSCVEERAVLTRGGTAAICLLSEHMTTVRQRIETSVPRKRKGGTSGHDKVRMVLFLFQW
jgi:protein pelota